MILSLDYDDTYTRDPEFWNKFIHAAKESGHIVYCVTMRYEHEAEPIRNAIGTRVDAIICTGRRAKQSFMYRLGIKVDVWIDDTPAWILRDAADAIQITKTEEH